MQYVGRYQPLPELIITVYKFIKIRSIHAAVITPRITAEQFISASTRKTDLHKLRSQLWYIIICIRLSYTRFFVMITDLRQNTLNIFRLQYHLIMLCRKSMCHNFRFIAFIKSQFIPSVRASPGWQPLQLCQFWKQWEASLKYFSPLFISLLLILKTSW